MTREQDECVNYEDKRRPHDEREKKGRFSRRVRKNRSILHTRHTRNPRTTGYGTLAEKIAKIRMLWIFCFVFSRTYSNSNMGKKYDEQWKQRLKELKTYKKKHGDCLVPARYKHNRKLGKWVYTQRLQYKKWLKGESAFITQERIDQLNEIDFVWDARFERKSNKSNKSNQDSVIPSVVRRNVVASIKSNRPKKRQMPSKDRSKKRQRRRQSQNVAQELSPSERKERRRFALQALKNWRNPMRPDEVVSI